MPVLGTTARAIGSPRNGYSVRPRSHRPAVRARREGIERPRPEGRGRICCEGADLEQAASAAVVVEPRNDLEVAGAELRDRDARNVRGLAGARGAPRADDPVVGLSAVVEVDVRGLDRV